jgi:hypothetical protein
MFKTAGWRSFVAWMAADPARTITMVADLIGVSRPAVSNWKRAVARPDRRHWPTLRKLCGIDEDLWLTRAERKEQEATANRIANGTTG